MTCPVVRVWPVRPPAILARCKVFDTPKRAFSSWDLRLRVSVGALFMPVLPKNLSGEGSGRMATPRCSRSADRIVLCMVAGILGILPIAHVCAQEAQGSHVSVVQAGAPGAPSNALREATT